jgi:hypothetical protein
MTVYTVNPGIWWLWWQYHGSSSVPLHFLPSAGLTKACKNAETGAAIWLA